MNTASPRPKVTLKLATSLDGRIALANGQSQWITGPVSREHVHDLRAQHHGILTGIGTVLADNPKMTARPHGSARKTQPQRIIMDTRLRTPEEANILKGGGAWIFHGLNASKASLPHVELFSTPRDAFDHVCIRKVLETIFNRGVQTVLIEAGAGISGAILREDLVDRIEWFRAPKMIGGDGHACVADLGLEALSNTPIFERVSVRESGADLWETYKRG